MGFFICVFSSDVLLWSLLLVTGWCISFSTVLTLFDGFFEANIWTTVLDAGLLGCINKGPFRHTC